MRTPGGKRWWETFVGGRIRAGTVATPLQVGFVAVVGIETQARCEYIDITLFYTSRWWKKGGLKPNAPGAHRYYLYRNLVLPARKPDSPFWEIVSVVAAIKSSAWETKSSGAKEKVGGPGIKLCASRVETSDSGRKSPA